MTPETEQEPMFKIEKNVALPASWGRAGSKKYPFGEMQVGDSFTAQVKQTRLSNAAATYARYHGGGLKFTTRKIDDANTRIWRIA